MEVKTIKDGTSDKVVGYRVTDDAGEAFMISPSHFDKVFGGSMSALKDYYRNRSKGKAKGGTVEKSPRGNHDFRKGGMVLSTVHTKK